VCSLSVENCLQGVLTLLGVIAVGVFLGRKGVISDQAEQAITALTVRFSIPFLLFDNAREYITIDFLREIGPWLLVPFTVILASSAISMLLASLFKVKQEDRGIFMILFAYSNAILIGLPIVTEIFGNPLSAAMFFISRNLFAGSAEAWKRAEAQRVKHLRQRSQRTHNELKKVDLSSCKGHGSLGRLVLDRKQTRHRLKLWPGNQRNLAGSVERRRKTFRALCASFEARRPTEILGNPDGMRRSLTIWLDATSKNSSEL
jgi:hypothetical protein